MPRTTRLTTALALLLLATPAVAQLGKTIRPPMPRKGGPASETAPPAEPPPASETAPEAAPASAPETPTVTAGTPVKPSDESVEAGLPPMVEEPAVRKEFSPEEVRRACAKYKGQLIAYYGDVYRVENCERRPLLNNKTVYTMLREGHKIIDVDGDTVAMIPEGEPVDRAMSIEAARGCKELEGRYVSFSSVDVYFVEKCKKRIFTDWTTYIEHRERREDVRGEIMALSWVEFAQLPVGEPVPSVVDDMFKKLLSGDAGVEVIPVDEACAGIEGQIVTYYQRLYRIERCRKREIVEPDYFVKRAGLGKPKWKELRSDQWLSLPDGQPIDDRPRRNEKQGKNAALKEREREAEAPVSDIDADAPPPKP